MSKKSWGFIGAGRVTRILMEGFKRADGLADRILVNDIDGDVAADLQKKFLFLESTKDAAEVARQDYVFLALHPPAMTAGMEGVRNRLKEDAVIISLAPKVTLERLTAGLNGFNRITRWLPSAASLIGRGHNPCAFSHALAPAEQSELKALFSSVGDCIEVPEEKIEAYAMIIAMGPTYFWFQWQHLFELGRTFGLSEEELASGMPAMLSGAIELFYHAGLTPGEVHDLIPVRPLAEEEPAIRSAYENKLTALFQKLKR